MSETAYEVVPAVETDEAPPHVGTLVLKFGGTSVADPEKIRRVAQRLVSAKQAGGRVVGVVSAMGQHTDELVALAHQVSPRPKPRELDMLISVGERISCALVAMAISDLGQEAISLLENANQSFAPDARLKTLLGVLLMTVDADRAASMLREALALDPNTRAARHTLAKLLASRGGETRWEEVKDLFEEAHFADAANIEDKRLEAQLLAKRGGTENRKRAIAILEELARSGGRPARAR